MKSNIAYWVATVLLCISFIGMGLSNYLQPGDMNVEIVKSGYPSHFFKFLGVWQVLGAIVILVPKMPRFKEWAYAGILINVVAAAHHHYMVADGPGKIFIPLVVLGVAIASYVLRPLCRRLQGSQFNRLEP
ncbi:MAG: DoxX family protein [Planctomycetota bacterium]|nr:DoxX family protein [Planctomycetota bacterium]